MAERFVGTIVRSFFDTYALVSFIIYFEHKYIVQVLLQTIGGVLNTDRWYQ